MAGSDSFSSGDGTSGGAVSSSSGGITRSDELDSSLAGSVAGGVGDFVSGASDGTALSESSGGVVDEWFIFRLGDRYWVLLETLHQLHRGKPPPVRD